MIVKHNYIKFHRADPFSFHKQICCNAACIDFRSGWMLQDRRGEERRETPTICGTSFSHLAFSHLATIL